MKMTQLQCLMCNKPFERQTNHVRYNIKKGYKTFCSMKCANDYQRQVSETESPQCPICNKHFKRQKSRMDQRYCSRKCGHKGQTLRKEVICLQCGKTFLKPHHRIKKSPNHFCGLSCAGTFNNAHKTKGARVSKLEKWLQEQLPLLYPNLEFHFNRSEAIEAELDIYIPSLKLAFELNGIFHYEPIHGPERLASAQKNDNRKILVCAERGIGLCVIDNSSMKYFKPEKAEIFLTIIKNVIESSAVG